MSFVDDTLREQLADILDRERVHLSTSKLADALLPLIREHTAAVQAERERVEVAEARVELASRDADYLGARTRRAEAAIERVRVLADVSDWHVYESQDTGDVYPADTVRDLLADIRAALDGGETP